LDLSGDESHDDNGSDMDDEQASDLDGEYMDLSAMLSGEPMLPVTMTSGIDQHDLINPLEIPSEDEGESSEDEIDLSRLIDDDGNMIRSKHGKEGPTKKYRPIEEQTEAYEESEFHLPNYSSTGPVDFSTLMGALAETEGGDMGFGKLKHQVLQLKRDNDETKREEAPLPDRLQARIQRQVAYTQATENASKWQPIVEKNRDAPSLQFPMQVDRQVMSTGKLVSDYKSQSKLDQAIEETMAASQFNELDVAPELPYNPTDPAAIRQRQEELREMRELAFRHEIKMKRRAKIKSKSYRKILKKERTKEKEKELEHLLQVDPDAARDQAIRMELERVKGRMTLKSKNKAKWAQFMLQQGGDGGEATREMILEQIQEEQELKQRIQGSTLSDHDESEPEEPVSKRRRAEVEGQERNQRKEEAPKGLFGMKFMQRAAEVKQRLAEADSQDELDSESEGPLPGRRFVGVAAKPAPAIEAISDIHFTLDRQGEPSLSDDEHDGSSNPWMQHVGRTGKDDQGLSGSGKLHHKQMKLVKSLSKGETEDKVESLQVNVDALTSSCRLPEPAAKTSQGIVFEQQELVAMAFAGDNVVEEFAQEKHLMEEKEGPQQIDETLPGWVRFFLFLLLR
jgi:U3 small nucleolar RNA-associated protein 14